MSRRGNALRREVEAELERLGIRGEFGITGGSHQYAEFHVNGRRRRYFFPQTPGSTWAGKEAVYGIRRMVRGVPA
jgi:hypothetical protein